MLSFTVIGSVAQYKGTLFKGAAPGQIEAMPDHPITRRIYHRPYSNNTIPLLPDKNLFRVFFEG